jgi:hypothetical protein
MITIKTKLRYPDIISSYLRKNHLYHHIGVKGSSASKMTVYIRFVDFYDDEEIQKVLDYFENHPPPPEVQREIVSQMSGGEI